MSRCRVAINGHVIISFWVIFSGRVLKRFLTHCAQRDIRYNIRTRVYLYMHSIYVCVCIYIFSIYIL